MCGRGSRQRANRAVLRPQFDCPELLRRIRQHAMGTGDRAAKGRHTRDGFTHRTLLPRLCTSQSLNFILLSLFADPVLLCRQSCEPLRHLLRAERCTGSHTQRHVHPHEHEGSVAESKSSTISRWATGTAPVVHWTEVACVAPVASASGSPPCHCFLYLRRREPPTHPPSTSPPSPVVYTPEGRLSDGSRCGAGAEWFG